MHSRWGQFRRRGGAAALATLLLVSASPGDARTLRHVVRLAKAPPVAPSGFGAFTPSAADPRLAAIFARSGLGTPNFSAGAFRFTPSGQPTRRAVTVAMRARSVGRTDAAHNAVPTTTLASSAYSLGMSVGWRRFALSGDVTKSDGGLLPDSRESADVGFSFMGKRWSTKLDVAADRATGDRPAMVGADQSWSVGLGGSYSLTRNIDVIGGLRYKAQHDELKSLMDDRRDSQAVYLGTTFRF